MITMLKGGKAAAAFTKEKVIQIEGRGVSHSFVNHHLVPVPGRTGTAMYCCFAWHLLSAWFLTITANVVV